MRKAAPYARWCRKPHCHHEGDIYRLRHLPHGQIFYRLCSSRCPAHSSRTVRVGVLV
ncbi:Uncharacterised protein [Vibrio cholerae]|nr:Uncharacterised protein [Vibrio cholerae]